MNGLDNIKKKALDGFLELAFMAEQDIPENQSSFAAFLYKWLDVIESCNAVKNDFPLQKKLQNQRVQTALPSTDLSNAKEMISGIKTTALRVVQEMFTYDIDYDNRMAFPVQARNDFADNGEVAIQLEFSSPKEKPPVSIVTGVMFLNLTSYLRLDSKRFQKCPKCGKFFYQYNRRNQMFCSRPCSNMGRTGKMYDNPI